MTVTITEQLVDATGQPDNAAWTFSSPLRENAGTVVTIQPVTVRPINGQLTVQLEPGPVTAKFRGETFYFTVPDTDSELWPLISAAVAAPPGTPQDTIAVAVSDYMQAHPPVTQAGIVGETINYNFSTGAAPPASQQFRLDNTDPSLATHAYLSTTSSDGGAMRNFLLMFSAGGNVAFQDFNDDTKFHRYDINATPIDNGTWFDLPITWTTGTGLFNNTQKTPMIIFTFTA
jgi:hypothetical protein